MIAPENLRSVCLKIVLNAKHLLECTVALLEDLLDSAASTGGFIGVYQSICGAYA